MKEYITRFNCRCIWGKQEAVAISPVELSAELRLEN